MRPFCNAIEDFKLPELSLFEDASEKKIAIYFMLLNVFEYKTEVFMSLVDRQNNTGACVHITISDFRLHS